MDGYGILHELYDTRKLEWASGGCYAEQHRATEEFYQVLIQSGVDPIVILDGGGTKTSIEDIVHRRKRNINEIPKDLKKHHENAENTEHHFPLLSRQVYASTLKQIHNLQMYVADGKARETVVSLANHYHCPILTNNTNYCVSGVAGGVIFFKHLDIDTCTAPVFNQTDLVRFLRLPDPDLVFAIVAIMGDGSDTSVPYLYHGGIKADIKRKCSAPDIALQGRSWIFNVVDYLRAYRISSWREFKGRVKTLNFGTGQRRKLEENCIAAETTYSLASRILTVEILKENTTLQCSQSDRLPEGIVKNYRLANFPSLVVNAICLGKCTLDPNIGDPDQPPIPLLGRPVRQMMYGFAMPLMSASHRRCITEYHRNEKVDEAENTWEYMPHQVQPRKYRDLSIFAIFELDERKREEMAKSALCEVLQPPPKALSSFDGPTDRSYILATLTTNFWAQNLLQSQQLDHPVQLIKGLVLNFLFSRDRDERESRQGLYQNPMWIKVYHALLEWQSLYQDVCGLNSMFLSPLLELPLTNILDGPFVMELALHPSPEIITTYRGKLNPEKQELYDKIVQVITI